MLRRGTVVLLQTAVDGLPGPGVYPCVVATETFAPAVLVPVNLYTLAPADAVRTPQAASSTEPITTEESSETSKTHRFRARCSLTAPAHCIVALLRGRPTLHADGERLLDELVMSEDEFQLCGQLLAGQRCGWGTARPFHSYSSFSWTTAKADAYAPRTESHDSSDPEGHALHGPDTPSALAAVVAGGYLQAIEEAMSAKTQSQGAKAYYSAQHDLAQAYVSVSKLQSSARFDILEQAAAYKHDETRDEVNEHWKVKMAVRGSLAINVLLLVIKLVSFIRSRSLTVLASTTDSFLDLFSGGVLLLTTYLMNRDEKAKYPTGKRAFEALGVLVFSCCMFVAAAQLLQESITSIADIKKVKLDIDFFTIGTLIFVVVAKTLMYCYCKALADESTSCEALACDHRNDVLSNTLSVAALFLAKYKWKYADPLVAIVVTLYIMVNWARNAYEQIMALNGRSADASKLCVITFAALHHHPDIEAVDTVRAVSAGTGYTCEVDVVLPREMLLQDAHDVGESLQLFLEKCPDLEVSRAYVHLDYETEHSPWEHR